MKLIIAGTRSFQDYDLLCKILKETEIGNIEEIVCGGARGADKLGERYAKEFGYSLKYFYPNWEKYGKSAGIIRNHAMGDYADYLLAFWDGTSKGTKDMIDYMKKIGKHGKVIIYGET